MFNCVFLFKGGKTEADFGGSLSNNRICYLENWFLSYPPANRIAFIRKQRALCVLFAEP